MSATATAASRHDAPTPALWPEPTPYERTGVSS